MNEKVLVSICCITYNQEKYISKALESFLSQNTNFRYEIIVHDDASTDNTQKIIEEYYKKYPDIIVPFFEKENVYQTGTHILPLFSDRIRGKYVATCEGDDYWIDNNKLQKQVDILENNSSLSACAHNTLIINEQTNEESKLNVAEKEDCLMNVERILEWENNYCFHFSSMIMKTELFVDLPDFYLNAKGFGDYPLALWLSINGPIFYINEEMSVYRKFSEGCWTLSKENCYEKELNHKQHLIDMYNDFNEETDGKYNHLLKRLLKKEHNRILLLDFQYEKELTLSKKVKARSIYYIDRLKYYFGRIKVKLSQLVVKDRNGEEIL